MSKRRQPQQRPRRLLWPIFFGLACLFVWASLLTFDVGDWPNPHQYPHHHPPHNSCGQTGAFLAYTLFYYIGDGVYPLILFLSMATGMWLFNGKIPHLLQRGFGLVLLCSATAAAVHLISAGGSNTLPEGDGGVLGTALGDFLQARFSGLGTVLVLGYAFIMGMLLSAEGWVLRLPGMLRWIGSASGEAVAKARDAANAVVPRIAHSPTSGAVPADRDAPEAPESTCEIKINSPRRRRAETHEPGDPNQGRLFDDTGVEDETKDPQKTAALPSEDDEEPEEKKTATRKLAKKKQQRHSTKLTTVEPKTGRGELVVNVSQQQEPPPTEAYPQSMKEWSFPPVHLLHQSEYQFSDKHESVVRAKAKVLEQTLGEFRLDARVVEIDTGPVITLYELSLAPGIKVSQVSSLSNDIARALRAPSIRIVAPIPGKNTIGVEVPNANKEKVRLRELLALAGPQASRMALPLFLGKDAGGSVLVTDLARMPHLLIAGTTGSGKSVCLNSIIAGILMTQRPDRCKLILVDPKMVEMSHFKNIPHLMSPIVTDVAQAESILEWAVTKMDERYELLAEAGVRNIVGYNKLTRKEIEQRFAPTSNAEFARIPKRIPYVIIVIDELADLMMTSPKEVEHHLSRLAQKSRAVGIHIVVATQRPEAKVVTGLIKSNLPCRIAFRVASRMDSRIVLDQNGAEVLMGQGDMLFLPPGSSKLLRAQGTLLEEDELHAMIDYLCERAQPEFHPQLVQLRPSAGGVPAERDELFDEAVEIILDSGRGSVSLLQRRLAVGYSRAARLIEAIAEAGIIGTHKGSVAREVLMTPQEWETLHAQRDEEETEDEG
ncbi:MAG: DNA translocase FtsK [Phycisphaerae bacterium]|nr:DNA translocase FtsK [Phycisphaerae bacterium]